MHLLKRTILKNIEIFEILHFQALSLFLPVKLDQFFNIFNHPSSLLRYQRERESRFRLFLYCRHGFDLNPTRRMTTALVDQPVYHCGRERCNMQRFAAATLLLIPLFNVQQFA